MAVFLIIFNIFAPLIIKQKNGNYKANKIVMKLKSITLIIAALIAATTIIAQPLKEPRKVDNPQITDLKNSPSQLPHWGEMNLLIFYADPDHPSQCADFCKDMEDNHRAAGDNIYGLGIVNLKDAPLLPNAIVRKIAYNRTKKNGATILADPDRIIPTQWGLGDCNNKFTMILISKEGELVYYHKGEFTKEDEIEFYKAIEPYR